MRQMTADDLRALFTALAATFAAQQAELGRLDAAVGDGDHGVGMARGFAAARDAVAASDKSSDALSGGFLDTSSEDVGVLLQVAGRAFMSAAGGASGPLFATIFLELAKVAVGDERLEPHHLAEGVSAAVVIIARLGRAAPGDKTMLDALEPAAAALRQPVEAGGTLTAVLERAADAARGGAEATTAMTARKGRARFVEGAGAGHPDPGAVSVALIFETWFAICSTSRPAGREEAS